MVVNGTRLMFAAVDGGECQSRPSTAGVYRGNCPRSSKPHWLVLLLGNQISSLLQYPHLQYLPGPIPDNRIGDYCQFVIA